MRAAVAICLLLAAGAPARAEPPAFVIVVNAENETTSVDRKLLADAFLKKVSRWADGETIHPVDQKPDAAVRRRFSESILRRSVAAIRSYWQQTIFSGRDVPPPELGDDTEVVRYVATHTGAVGYVSGDTAVEGVKILVVK